MPLRVGCQKPHFISCHSRLGAKSHVLLHFFSQKPRSASREKNLPAETPSPLKRNVAFDIFSETERGIWQAELPHLKGSVPFAHSRAAMGSVWVSKMVTRPQDSRTKNPAHKGLELGSRKMQHLTTEAERQCYREKCHPKHHLAQPEVSATLLARAFRYRGVLLLRTRSRHAWHTRVPTHQPLR